MTREEPTPEAARALLEQREEVLRYREMAGHLGLESPGAIRRVARLLETLMEQDHQAGRPFLSALVVGKNGVPRPGFFQTARALNRYQGPDYGAEAAAWHAEELRRLAAQR